MKSLLILLFGIYFIIHISSTVDVDLQCKSNGFQCINQTTFILCVEIARNLLVPSPVMRSCPKTFLCVDDSIVPCHEMKPKYKQLKTITTTTEVDCETKLKALLKKNNFSRKSPFNCKKAGRFPGPTCNQFFECTDAVFWYQLKLKSCPEDLWFNPYLHKCMIPSRSKCMPSSYE